MSISSAVLKVEVITDATKAAKGMDDASGRFGKLGKAAKIGGAAMVAGFAVAGAAAIALGKASVDSAKTQEDAFDHLNFTFGKNSAGMQDWAKSAAANYGLSAAEAGDMAAKIGNKLNGLGFPLDKTTQLTKTLADRAADMAAATGGTAAEALDALGGALAGKTKGLKNYGVMISKADIAAQRLADGTSKLTGSAGKQAEAQAVLTLAMKGTAKATGQYEKNAGDLDAQQQQLAAQTENLKASIGQALIPVLQKLAGFLLTSVVPALQAAWKWFGPILQQAITAVSTVVQTVLMPAFASLFGLFASNGPGAIGAVTSAAAPLIAALRGVGTFLTTVLLPAVLEIWSVFTSKLVPAFLTYARIVATNLLPLIAQLAAFFGGVLIPTLIRLYTGVATLVVPVFKTIIKIIAGVLIPTFLRLAGMIVSNVIPDSAIHPDPRAASHHPSHRQSVGRSGSQPGQIRRAGPHRPWRGCRGQGAVERLYCSTVSGPAKSL
jgi:hypothetical protein